MTVGNQPNASVPIIMTILAALDKSVTFLMLHSLPKWSIRCWTLVKNCLYTLNFNGEHSAMMMRWWPTYLEKVWSRLFHACGKFFKIRGEKKPSGSLGFWTESNQILETLLDFSFSIFFVRKFWKILITARQTREQGEATPNARTQYSNFASDEWLNV